MALDTQRIDVRNVQQSGVLRAVRGVARKTALSLNRRMFKGKGTAYLRVALHADHALIGRGSKVIHTEGAVNVVTIAALDQPFIHLVMEWHRKRGLHICVAGVTKQGLGNLQQIGFFAGCVNAMATSATYPCFSMRRAHKIRMHSYMAPEAGDIDLFG
jgi:hypothetical protein